MAFSSQHAVELNNVVKKKKNILADVNHNFSVKLLFLHHNFHFDSKTKTMIFASICTKQISALMIWILQLAIL